MTRSPVLLIITILFLVPTCAAFRFPEWVLCWFQNECCASPHIEFHKEYLVHAFHSKIYGQHIVNEGVVKYVWSHARTNNPSRALSLSFHGGIGTGKNYVSTFITQSLYKRGMKSRYVHLISSVKNYPHKHMLNAYKNELKNLIERSVTECERSLFIFDEVEKMPAGLLDTLKPYLDFHEQLDGVDYRKSVFIFLSNTAMEEIQSIVIEHYNLGRNRNDLKLRDFESAIIRAASNTEGGLWNSAIGNSEISAHLPFLPLKVEHVKNCIKDSIKAKRYYFTSFDKEHIIEKVIQMLPFYPEDKKLFSEIGCKRVSEKVDFVMAGDDF